MMYIHGNAFKLVFLILFLSHCASYASSNYDERVKAIVNMQKSIYSVLGGSDVTQIAMHFRPKFKELDVDGTLAQTLESLYEMRRLDLQISMEHAKKMKKVLEALRE